MNNYETFYTIEKIIKILVLVGVGYIFYLLAKETNEN